MLLFGPVRLVFSRLIGSFFTHFFRTFFGGRRFFPYLSVAEYAFLRDPFVKKRYGACKMPDTPAGEGFRRRAGRRYTGRKALHMPEGAAQAW